MGRKTGSDGEQGTGNGEHGTQHLASGFVTWLSWLEPSLRLLHGFDKPTPADAARQVTDIPKSEYMGPSGTPGGAADA